MYKCKTPNELQTLWETAKQLKPDNVELSRLTTVKDQMKSKFV